MQNNTTLPQRADTLIQQTQSVSSATMSSYGICTRRTTALQRTIISRFGEPKKFLKVFSPNMQHMVTANPYYAFKGDAPTLQDVAEAYGGNLAESWLEIHLKDLSEFTGCREKMTIAHIESAAKVMISHYGHLRVTEFMCFFHRFKAGRYGKFYGAVDPLVITTSLQEFLKERSEEISRIDTEYRKNLEQMERQIHDSEVEEFRKALATCNMSVEEWLAIDTQPRLSNEEIRLMGYMMRWTPAKAQET